MITAPPGPVYPVMVVVSLLASGCASIICCRNTRAGCVPLTIMQDLKGKSRRFSGMVSPVWFYQCRFGNGLRTAFFQLGRWLTILASI